MASLDWSNCEDVESIPGKVSGAWLLRGTRTPVQVVFDNLQAGLSIDEIVEQFPVSHEQVEKLLRFVSESLQEETKCA
jgi:uncharacterized protein (DUF433 family)